jgi:hypothetical protein
MKMEKHEMSEILHDVRKAYNLIASYQQRIVELLDFIKNELRAEHYWHNLPNSYSSQSIKYIYTDSNVGLNFLPMLDMQLLWYKNKATSYNDDWQSFVQPNDLVFDVVVKSKETDDSSALYFYVYKCVKYTRKKDWFNDVWWKKPYDYPDIGEEITYKDESGDIEYRIYGYKMDLSELFNGESTREAIDEFKKAVLINLGCDIN